MFLIFDSYMPRALRWPGGVVVTALTLRLKGHGVQISAVPLSGNNLGQVVHNICLCHQAV